MENEKQFMVLFHETVKVADLYIPSLLGGANKPLKIEKGLTRIVCLDEMFGWLNLSHANKVNISIYEIKLKFKS